MIYRTTPVLEQRPVCQTLSFFLFSTHKASMDDVVIIIVLDYHGPTNKNAPSSFFGAGQLAANKNRSVVVTTTTTSPTIFFGWWGPG
jgi:hypothetical protein